MEGGIAAILAAAKLFLKDLVGRATGFMSGDGMCTGDCRSMMAWMVKSGLHAESAVSGAPQLATPISWGWYWWHWVALRSLKERLGRSGLNWRYSCVAPAFWLLILRLSTPDSISRCSPASRTAAWPDKASQQRQNWPPTALLRLEAPSHLGQAALWGLQQSFWVACVPQCRLPWRADDSGLTPHHRFVL